MIRQTLIYIPNFAHNFKIEPYHVHSKLLFHLFPSVFLHVDNHMNSIEEENY